MAKKPSDSRCPVLTGWGQVSPGTIWGVSAQIVNVPCYHDVLPHVVTGGA